MAHGRGEASISQTQPGLTWEDTSGPSGWPATENCPEPKGGHGDTVCGFQIDHFVFTIYSLLSLEIIALLHKGNYYYKILMMKLLVRQSDSGFRLTGI